MIKKWIKTIKSWYTKDENDHVNRVAQVIFAAGIAFPVIVVEGIKVGFYDKFTQQHAIGLSVLLQGLLTPIIKVYQMGKHAAFGSQTRSWKPDYLIILGLIYLFAVVMSYVSAELYQDKRNNKNDNMKFGKIADFNKEMAFPIGSDDVLSDGNIQEDNANMIISKSIRYNLAGTSSTYSCALVIGSTGSGKSFTYVKPNILQMSSSIIVTDPKCELIHDCGKVLADNGYDVLLFNLKKGEQAFSCRYNPFAYIHNEQDVILAVDSFLNATTDKNGTGGDPFFPIAEKNFYYALFYYVFTMLPPEERTLKAVYELYAQADEPEQTNKDKRAEVLENNFTKAYEDVAEKDPYNPCLPFYNTFKKGSPKTKQSILISVGIKMWFLSVPETANLLSGDDLHFNTIGERKTALFIAIPTDSDSFKCLSAMLFSQLFQELYYQGETLNPRTYLIKKGMCTAGRSSQFVEGAGEEDARNEMITRQQYFQNAKIVYEKDLAERNVDVDRYLKRPLDEKLKIFPFPQWIVCDDEDPKKAHIYEKFRSLQAAKEYLDCGQTGEIVNLQDGLAVRTRFLLDEFYAIGKIEGFESKIATFRSLKMSCDVICQNVQQLKEMYDDKEGKVVGNCDIKICLGVNSLEDAKMFSEMVGESDQLQESINIDTKGIMHGASGGSLSRSEKTLISPAWLLNKMKGDTLLVLVRTNEPMKDKKYNPKEQHPNWAYTYDKRNKDSYGNAYPFRRIFYIEQRPEARIKTIMGPRKSAVAQSNAPQLPDSNTVQTRVAKNVTQSINLTNDDKIALANSEQIRITKEEFERVRAESVKKHLREFYKENLNEAHEKQSFKTNEKGDVYITSLTPVEKERLRKCIVKGEIVQDKNDSNRLVSKKYDMGDALSALTDLM